MDEFCPRCSDYPNSVASATVHAGEPRRVDLALHCRCSVSWTARGVTLDAARQACQAAIVCNPSLGSTHAAYGMLLEVGGEADEAYEAHGVALGCRDAFDRTFSYERRGAYEAGHGWLRNALRSFRAAFLEATRRGDPRAGTFRDAAALIERELAARGVLFPPEGADGGAPWRHDCEVEVASGFAARDEVGQPLADDVLEFDRLVSAGRWEEAVAALRAFRTGDANKFVTAIPYARRGAELAHSAGNRSAAVALQSLVVEAFVVVASWSSSGAEAAGRLVDVERERARLRGWERDAGGGGGEPPP
jgi:hypothetical protein